MVCKLTRTTVIFFSHNFSECGPNIDLDALFIYHLIFSTILFIHRHITSTSPSPACYFKSGLNEKSILLTSTVNEPLCVPLALGLPVRGIICRLLGIWRRSPMFRIARPRKSSANKRSINQLHLP